ncbi:hypothetical protein Rcas_2559 [Roseiflexus castenholzii DSM 13941]|uniref:PIN domain-containing protein n=1 Tax=Roseiflexus castenholzii (strain DSM 13941 / HLO8) TaxID=383372 RepID=A7NM82_ROSCS|nr:hypothetical protein Rcas_2559 [Roseiflexus castenholzii DSM 13941]
MRGNLLNTFLVDFLIIEIDEDISHKAVELLEEYRLSHELLIADSFIAVIALSCGYPLESRNQRDYRFIRGTQSAAL